MPPPFEESSIRLDAAEYGSRGNCLERLISKRMNKTKRQRTADKIVTKDIFSDTSSQGRNAFYLKGNLYPNTSNRGHKERAAHCWAAPEFPIANVR
jgi:hypothetical protein